MVTHIHILAGIMGNILSQADTRYTSTRYVYRCACVACTVSCNQFSNCRTMDASLEAGIYVNMVDELITTGRPIVNGHVVCYIPEFLPWYRAMDTCMAIRTGFRTNGSSETKTSSSKGHVNCSTRQCFHTRTHTPLWRMSSGLFTGTISRGYNKKWPTNVSNARKDHLQGYM